MTGCGDLSLNPIIASISILGESQANGQAFQLLLKFSRQTALGGRKRCLMALKVDTKR